ncbi:hypothetical protein BDZ97DRAFT_1761924 [Flammula alnicola]|nr:hypothetical protein BDZ97DRAFT_1761924 [Flammula alnicola]
MAPVTLPPPNRNVSLPPVPQDPPSHEDVTRAYFYVKCAELAYKADVVPPAVFSDALTYQTKIVSSKLTHGDAGAVAPAWLQPALTQLKSELQTSIDGLQTSMDQFHEKMDRFDVKLTSIERTCALSYNMSVGDGLDFNYKHVPFADGSDPVMQHNLPALNTMIDVHHLSDNDLKAYYTRYIGPVGNRLKKTQIKGVCTAIGMRL